MNDLFVTASRKKWRFESNKGLLTVEDLWELSLTSLDNVAVALDEKIQKAGRKSFVSQTRANTDLSNQLELIKYIITTKQVEDEEKKIKTEKQNQAAFLKDLLTQKKMQQMEALSAEEIENRLKALEG